MIASLSPPSAQPPRQPLANISNQVQTSRSVEKRSAPEETGDDAPLKKRQKKADGKPSKLQTLLRLDDNKDLYLLVRVLLAFVIELIASRTQAASLSGNRMFSTSSILMVSSPSSRCSISR